MLPSDQTIRELRERLRGAPVVSVYAPVGAEMRDGLETRITSSLAETSAPENLIDDVLSDLAVAGRGRTLALFRTPSASERIELEVELPITDAQTGWVDARCGEAPFLLPLEMAFANGARICVAYVDRERYRLFETFLGHIEEIDHDARMPHAAYETSPASKQVPGAQGRDDAHRDRQQDHEAEVRDRMYKRLGTSLAKIIGDRDIETLLVVGTARNVAAMMAQLPAPVAELAVAGSSSLPDPDAAPPAVLDAVRDELGGLEAARQSEVMAKLGESGVSGLDKVLQAIQNGRAGTLVLPWDISGTVYRTPDGFVATDRETCRKLAPGEEPESLRLADALEALITRFDLDLSILTAERAEQLRADHAGIAAIPRW